MRRTSWLFALLLLVGLVTVAPADAAAGKVRTTQQVIGRSVEGRAIVAYHRYRVGDATAHTAVLIGQVHGNETAGRTVAWKARKATLPAHLDLWIIVSANPDGYAHHRRQNAHGTRLPIRTFDCHGGCYGTMTQWFNHAHHGAAITMELPSRPSAAFLRHVTSGTLAVLAKGT
jgi:murein tripeptide amidase MpaA